MTKNEATSIIYKIASALNEKSILVGLALVKELNLDCDDQRIAEAYRIVNSEICAVAYKSYKSAKGC